MLGNLAVLRWRTLRMDASDVGFMEGAKLRLYLIPKRIYLRANQFVVALVPANTPRVAVRQIRFRGLVDS